MTRYEEVVSRMVAGNQYTVTGLARRLGWNNNAVSDALKGAYVHRLVERDARAKPHIWTKSEKAKERIRG